MQRSYMVLSDAIPGTTLSLGTWYRCEVWHMAVSWSRTPTHEDRQGRRLGETGRLDDKRTTWNVTVKNVSAVRNAERSALNVSKPSEISENILTCNLLPSTSVVIT